MAFSFMIVDDSLSMRKVLIKAIRMCHLGDSGFYQAGNGREALDILTGQRVDLIFTDINMPEMNGFAFVEAVLRNPAISSVPIVVITSETRRIELENLLNGKVAAIINKPFRPEEIRDIIVKLLKLEGLHGAPEDTQGYDF